MPTTKRMHAALGSAVVLAALGVLVGAATSAEPTGEGGFALHGATPEGEAHVLHLEVPGDATRQRVTLFRGKDAPTQVRLHLTPFRGAKGAVDVGLQVSGRPAVEEPSFSLDLALQRKATDLDLVLPAPLAEGAQLTGALSVERAAGAAQSFEIVLTRRGAVLARAGQWLAAHWTAFAAGLALVLGILVSVWSETWLERRRESQDVQARIARIRPIWLRAEPSWPPVVRVKALLKQAQDRSRDAWTVGSRIIDQRIEQADRLIQLLRRARNVRMGFQETPMPEHPWLVRFRARATLRRIMRNIGMEALDDKATGHFQAELHELEGWLEPKQLPELYTRSVSQSIDQLLMEIRLEGFRHEKDKKLVGALLERVQDGRKALEPSEQGPAEFSWPATLQTVEAFAALKLLWERRSEPEYEKLIECCQKKCDVQAFFDVADQAAWQRLREASTAGELEIRPAQTTGDDIEAFEPIRFEVHSGKRALDMTHLFHYELTWDWRIEIEPRHRRWLPWRKKKILTPRSTEPQVVQYAPMAGTVSAFVKITFDRAPIEDREIDVKLDQPLHIVPSETFRRLQFLKGTQGITTALAVVVALAVGLEAAYVGNPAFEDGRRGTLAAYITLFLWGVGTDKVKSFLAKLPSRPAEDEPAARPAAQGASEAADGSPGQH